MNPAVLRLALVGSRSSLGRLAGIVGGVAVGVCLLLLVWGAGQGMIQRDARALWLDADRVPAVVAAADAEGSAAAEEARPVPLTADTALVDRADEVFRNQLVQRRDVAVTEDSAVRIPGIGAPPEPGTYYASPALQDLIESVPADQLGDRFGTLAGTIEDTDLAGPDSLVAVTGAEEAELRQRPAAAIVPDFSVNSFADNTGNYRTLMVVGGIAVLFPVLLLISISTRLGAAQRAERFATLRLIGASPRTVAGIAAVEIAATSLLGSVLGVVAAAAVRPLAAQLPVDGTRLHPADLAVGPVTTAAVVAVVVAASAAVAGLRTLRAGIGPLGAARAQAEPAPTARRTVPLAAGLAAMGTGVLLADTGRLDPGALEVLLIGGVGLTAVGIVVVGPWLTLLAARIGLARASGAAAVIAAGRIRLTPRATFRSVSGLVIGVFMVSVFAGASSSVGPDETPSAGPGMLPPASVHTWLEPDRALADVTGLAGRAEGLDGVRDTVVGWTPPAADPGGSAQILLTDADATVLGFEDVPAAPVVALDAAFFEAHTEEPRSLTAAPVTDLQGLVPALLVVDTDGSPGALDRARTVLTASGLSTTAAVSRADAAATGGAELVRSLSVLAYAAAFVVVVIAGISLAVATAAAVIDRRRVLGLMRLIGMPLSALRGVVVREAAVPLAAVLLLSAGLGFCVAWLLVTGLDDSRTVSWPGPAYLAALGASLLLALVAIAAACGMLRTNTAITTTRFE